MNFLLADDHSIVRMGLRLIIEKAYPEACFEIMENGNAVMEKTKSRKYDLIILDFQMPNTDIFNVISFILARDEKAKILVYTMASENVYAPKAFASGVKGFLSKEAENSEIIHALRAILNGGCYPNEQLDNKEPGSKSVSKKINPFSILSNKELDILHYLIRGKNTKEISILSHLQMSTISTHKARIFNKLNINNMVELIALAREYDLS